MLPIAACIYVAFLQNQMNWMNPDRFVGDFPFQPSTFLHPEFRLCRLALLSSARFATFCHCICALQWFGWARPVEVAWDEQRNPELFCFCVAGGFPEVQIEKTYQDCAVYIPGLWQCESWASAGALGRWKLRTCWERAVVLCMQDAVNGNIIVNILWIQWLLKQGWVRKKVHMPQVSNAINMRTWQNSWISNVSAPWQAMNEVLVPPWMVLEVSKWSATTPVSRTLEHVCTLGLLLGHFFCADRSQGLM